MRISRLLGLPTLALTVLAGMVPLALTGAGPAHAGGPPGSSITLAVTPGPLAVLAAPCGGKPLDIDLGNTSTSGAYVDVFITPEAPLITSHDVISTYVPPAAHVVVRARISAPLGSEGGTSDIDVRVGTRGPQATVSADVTQKPSGPGANLALGGPVTASSTHGNFNVCGGVDGNSNVDDWSTLTGWNDGTRSVWPDTYTVDWGDPVDIDRIVLHTLASARYPGDRNALRDFDVQVFDGMQFVTTASVRGNIEGRLEFVLDPVVKTASVRIVGLGSFNNDYSRIVELEVYQAQAQP